MNYQNIPRSDTDNPDAPIVKRAFLPKQDALAFFDWDNMENRVGAYYLIKAVGDTQMFDRLMAGVDLHTATAEDIFGTVEGLFQGVPRRQVAKKVNYSIFYGGGIPTLTAQLGLPKQEIKKILNRFHEKNPGIRKLMARLDKVYARRGYIRSLYGRRLRVELGKEYSLVAQLIQGSCAEIMKRSMVAVHQLLGQEFLYQSVDGPHMVASIHDEILIDTPKDRLSWLAESIPPLMTDPIIETVVPLPVGMEVTFTNWAEKEEYERL